MATTRKSVNNMRTLTFLCLISTLAFTLASSVPEEREEEINKRVPEFYVDSPMKRNATLDKMKEENDMDVDEIKDGVTKVDKEISDLVIDDGKINDTLVITSVAGKTIMKTEKGTYQLNENLYNEAKKKFQEKIKNVDFDTVLYNVFPLLKADVHGCKKKVSTVIWSEGGASLAKAGEPVYDDICKLRDRIIKIVKDEITDE